MSLPPRALSYQELYGIHPIQPYEKMVKSANTCVSQSPTYEGGGQTGYGANNGSIAQTPRPHVQSEAVMNNPGDVAVSNTTILIICGVVIITSVATYYYICYLEEKRRSARYV